MKTMKALTILIAIPVLLAGCDRKEMPHEWHAWEPIVSADHKVAMAPKCPGWNYSIDKYVPPEGEADFGCANASNLAFMVARPKDLIQGRGLAGRDAARHDLTIDKYREGKIAPLLKNERIINTQ